MSKNNNGNFPGRIKDWLEKQGQSLEMRVAKSFRENGFVASQFEYYVDQETQTVRQTDVVASVSRSIGNSYVTVKLAIECKYAKSKPWVILITQQKFGKFSFFGRMLNGENPSNWKNLPTIQGRLTGKIALSLERSKEIEVFEVNPAGYAIMEARLDSQTEPDPRQRDYAYEAVMQVTKGVEYQDNKNEEVFGSIVKSYEEALEFEKGYRTMRAPPTLGLDLTIVIPAIVINGRLFKSYLDDNNAIEVSEIENGFVLMPSRIDGTKTSSVPLSSIMIITEYNLDAFIPKLRKMMENILDQEDAIRELIDFEESKIYPLTKSDF
jgi:hypothetical protein